MFYIYPFQRHYIKLLLCFFIVCATCAITVNSVALQIAPSVTLNEAVVLVGNQNDVASPQDLLRGLRQVLIKLSGNPGVMTVPEVKNSIGNINQWVERYSFYVKVVNGHRQRFLRVRYNRDAVERLLHNANQTLWTGQRPITLVWLAAPDQSAWLVTLLQQWANESGMALRIPNQSNEPWAKLMAGEPLMNAPDLQLVASRYHVTSLLAGKITAATLQSAKDTAHTTMALPAAADGSVSFSTDRWHGKWFYIFNQQSYHWTTTGNNPALVMRSALDKLATIVAMQTKQWVNVDKKHIITMKVSGIQTIQDYATMLRFLHRQVFIQQLFVSELNNSSVLLTVTVSGPVAALTHSLQLNKHFVLIPPKAVTTQSGQSSGQNNYIVGIAPAEAESEADAVTPTPLSFRWRA